MKEDLRAIQALNEHDVAAVLRSDITAIISQWTNDFVMIPGAGLISATNDLRTTRAVTALPLTMFHRSSAMRVVASGSASPMAISHSSTRELFTQSTLSWRVIAHGAGHSLHHDRLDLVVAEVSLLLHYLRGEAKPPFGSTVTE